MADSVFAIIETLKVETIPFVVAVYRYIDNFFIDTFINSRDILTQPFFAEEQIVQMVTHVVILAVSIYEMKYDLSCLSNFF